MKHINININSKNTIIILLNVLFVIIISYNLFYKQVESFSVNDIDNMFDDIKDVTKAVNKLPNEINNIDTKLTQQVNNVATQLEKKTEEMAKEIEKKTITILTDKLKSVFIQIGDIFNKGIIEPILAVFNGIGNIFVQIFNILKETGNKIISLPNCIMTYMITEAINTFYFFYNIIMPKFLKNIASSIYHYTLRYIFDFIGYITGYSDSVKRCYGFNVSTEVDKINSNLNDINSSFKKDFGHMDFSKIQI
jgi:predicted PurR-regulated permease PerM